MRTFAFLFLVLSACAPSPGGLQWTPPERMPPPTPGPFSKPTPTPKPEPTATPEPVPTPTPNPSVDPWFARLHDKIIKPKCLDCHNPAKPQRTDLSTYESIMAKEGLVIPKDPDNSILWQVVAAEEMPPRNPIADEDKEAIYNWIGAGAPKEVPLP